MSRKARRLLAEHPEVATADISTACVVGEVVGVDEMLGHDPALLNRKGGVLQWQPLLDRLACNRDSANV
jgi:hypothetical protein